MAVITPDWLTRRGGELQTSRDGTSWVVYFDREPQYLLMAVPVRGQFGCRISQTINGRRLDKDGAVYPNADDAARGGLEELRQALGW